MLIGVKMQPAAHILEHLFDNELRQLGDKPGLFSKRDKNIRREAASVRLRPARQRVSASAPTIFPLQSATMG